MVTALISTSTEIQKHLITYRINDYDWIENESDNIVMQKAKS